MIPIVKNVGEGLDPPKRTAPNVGEGLDPPNPKPFVTLYFIEVSVPVGGGTFLFSNKKVP